MCGIAGYAGLPYEESASRARIRAMCDAIRHRGPDAAGHAYRDCVEVVRRNAYGVVGAR